jgi:hypothetical protein
MSHFSVRGEQSTSSEITALTNLAALAASGAGEFIRKTGLLTFENATPGGSGFATAALDNLSSVAINAALVLGTSDAFALGSATKMWSDLFLASGAVINFNNGNVTLTHSAGVLTINVDFVVPDEVYGAGWNGSLEVPTKNAVYDKIEALIAGAGATTALDNLAAVAINTSLISDTDNTDALGSATIGWSDLFLGTGALINIANGNWVATHSSAILTVSTGDLRVTTAGTNAASVVTVGGTQTLTAKTLTSPIIGISPTAAGATWTDLGTVTTADINGGTLDGVTIGGASAAAATVTTLGAGAITSTGLLTITVAGNTARFINSTDGASVQVARFEGDRATMADADEAYISLMLSNDAGTQTEFGRITWVAVDVNAGTSVDGRIDFAVVTAGSLADEMFLDDVSLSPSTNDGLQLGTTALGWADLHLATGSIINWVNGDITLTHSAGKLTFGGDGAVELDFNNHEMTNVDINSGAIDGVIIGAASAAAATVTTLTQSKSRPT